MSEYEQKEFFKSFTERTKKNLELVEAAALANKDNAFEFTQLVNSLYGLLVLPHERYYNKFTKIDVANFPVTMKICKSVESWYPDEEKNVFHLFRHLRNSLAHPRKSGYQNYSGSIEFLPKNSSPKSIMFTDKLNDKLRGACFFRVEIQHNMLKSMVYEFCDVLVKYYPSLN